jgi:CHAT domain-containing protein
MGNEARRANAVAAIESGAAVVHFATHFLQQDSSPDRALLVLSTDASGQPDFFSTSDAMHVRVPGSLVVLSGCHSGAGTQFPAAGLMGMTRAWLAAGARGVIASLWPTPDDTGAIFQTFYRELQKEAPSGNGTGVSTKTAARKQRGMSLRNAAEALRRAQLEMLRTQTWRAMPKYWGTYQLIGQTT